MSVTGQDQEEVARLASRIAMLASHPGEAANAGRAVASMARRLGLSGGDLKEIFLTGLRADSSMRRVGGSGNLARENEALREHLDMAEIAAQQALRERDRLRRELQELRGALQSRRRNDVLAMVFAVVLLGVAGIGGAWFLAAPSAAPAAAVPQPAAAPGERLATIRSPGGATVRITPEPHAEILTQLPAGSRVTVHRLVWSALLQWAEIDLGNRSGFVETTDVDL